MKKPNCTVLILAILLICACREETECPSEIELGAFELLETSEDKYPYLEEDSVIIFKDLEGLAYAFKVANRSRRLENFSSKEVDCNIEGDKVRYNYTTETKVIDFWNESLDLGFQVVLGTHVDVDHLPEKRVADVLSIIEREPFFTNFAPLGLRIVVDQRGFEELDWGTQYATEKLIGDRRFNDVYWEQQLPENRKYRIYYNAEFGIIGIEDPSTEFLLVYDRKI